MRFAITDMVIVVASAVLAKIIYIDLYLGSFVAPLPYIGITLALAVTVYLFFHQMGLYEFDTISGPFIGLSKVWGGLALSSLVVLGLLYVLKQSETFSRGWLSLWFLLSASALIVARSLLASRVQARLKSGQLRQRVAIYGAQTAVGKLHDQLRATCGHIDVAAVFLDHTIGNGGLEDRSAEFSRALARNDYDQIIIAYPASDTGGIQTAVNKLAAYSTELLLFTDQQKVPVATRGTCAMGDQQLDIINVVPGSERARLIKFGMDFALAIAGLVALSPILLAIAALIKLDSRGPVLFRQDRYGHNNTIFRIFKFRTMIEADEDAGFVQTVRNDSRVTRVGRFLRRSSLDELPQLLNVLLGQMSIVGPRPHAIAHDDELELQVEQLARRRRVRPGLTGWAQVNGFRGETKQLADIRKRMDCDLYYVDHWSIWFDLEIIARTVVVLTHDAY